MIHLAFPITLDGRFSAQDLPHELQLPLLNNMVVPRIVSSSMTPTIHAGDRLDLTPPTSLTIGTIVVFRTAPLLVCHRITAIDEQGTLSTKGDATDGAGETVQPSAVIGVVTGVLREGRYLSLKQSPRRSSATARPTNLKTSIQDGLVRLLTRRLPVLARYSFCRHMLALLLRWTATVDVLIPAPLRSFPSHSRVASFTLRRFPETAALLAGSNGQNPTHYVVRLGPWRLAQYDPATGSILLRQSLLDAGLEPFLRQCCGAGNTTPH